MKKIISVFILFFFATHLQAKEIISGTKLYDSVFEHSMPPWIDTNAPDFDVSKITEHYKTYKNQEGPSFIREYIPAGEEFDTWTKMFAIKAQFVGRKIPILPWENSTLDTFKQYCADVQVKYLVQQAQTSLVQIICPKVYGLKVHGYDQGVGEIGVFAFYISGNTAISHYMEWRGNPFNGLDQSTWPITQKEVDHAITLIKKSKATSESGIITFE